MQSAVNAPALIQFWEENFKLQVEARSAHPMIEVQGKFCRCFLQYED